MILIPLREGERLAVNREVDLRALQGYTIRGRRY